MENITGNERIVKAQYGNSDNLDVRTYLHSKFSTNCYGWMRWLFDNMSFKNNCRVLELGCGNGALWSNNLYRVGEDWDIVITDFSSGMLEAAQKNINDLRFKFVQVDAQTIPFEDAAFDVVIANHMLYHIPNRKKALAEIKRVLKKGGIFYASTLGINNMTEISTLVNQFNPRIEYPYTSDIIHFNLENGTDELSNYFEKVEIKRYEDSLYITEGEPLVKYILSLKEFGNITSILVNDKVSEFSEYINEIIHNNQGVEVTKDAGLFISVK